MESQLDLILPPGTALKPERLKSEQLESEQLGQPQRPLPQRQTRPWGAWATTLSYLIS